MAKSKKPYEALKYKEFNFFLVVRLSMVLAWSMQFIVIEWQVYTLTKDALSLGVIGLMEVIPAVAMALFAGHYVDKFEKRKILIYCLLGFFAISCGLFYITSSNANLNLSTQQIIWVIYVLVFLGGIVRSFIGPATFALFSLVVPKKVYPNATTWSSSVWQMGGMIGPAMGGFLIHLIGVHWSMFVIVAITIVAFVFLLNIKKKPVIKKNIEEAMLTSLKNGIQFVFKTKEILGALTLDMISVLFGGAVALLPIFAQDILGVDSLGFGFLRAAPAVGAFLTMLTVAYFPLNNKAGLKLLWAIFGFGICIIVFGISTIFWVSLIALFFSGVTDGVSMVIRQTILQLKTPDDMRGRVSSVNSIFVGSSNELGAFESGFTAKIMGASTAVIFGGCMTLVTVLVSGLGFKKLRRLDFNKDIEAHENN